MKTDIREYAEREPVEIKEKDGRLVIEALNEGGHNGTEVDLIDVIRWVEINKPDLLAEPISIKGIMAMSGESYVTECLIIARQGETLFTLKPGGEVVASLKRYAIVPLEEYEHSHLEHTSQNTRVIQGCLVSHVSHDAQPRPV